MSSYHVGTAMTVPRFVVRLLVQGLLVTAVHAATLASQTYTATPRVTETAALTAPQQQSGDINCDGASTAADFVAAVIVSGDGARFPDCAAAEPFRARPLGDQDFLPLLQDLFATLDAPWTPTPSATPTMTATPSRTARVTASRTPSATPTPTRSPTPIPSATTTASPTATLTSTPTHTATITATPIPQATYTRTATPTPTGVAYLLSGEWFANWSHTVCYLDGQPFAALPDQTYRVTAIDGRLDITQANGQRIGAGLQFDSNGTVAFTYRVFDQRVCLINGTHQEFVFDYTFTFRSNGTGSATARWSYGLNTNCAVCSYVDDRAILRRISGPGT